MHLFFDLTYFRELGQKCKNIFVWFLVQMKTSKFAYEIDWPFEKSLIIFSIIWLPHIWSLMGPERAVFDINPDSLNLVWITDDEQRLEEDQEDDSEGPQPTPFNPLIFWPAALCDMTATSIQYIALTLTYASSFQMLRGKTKHLFFACLVFYQCVVSFSDNFTASK